MEGRCHVAEPASIAIAELIQASRGRHRQPGTPTAARSARARRTTFRSRSSLASGRIPSNSVLGSTSFARPGGNVSGVNFYPGGDLEAARTPARTGAQSRSHCVAGQSSQHPTTDATLREVQEAARALGLKFMCSRPAQPARSMRLLTL